MEHWKEDIFFENEDMPQCDIDILCECLANAQTTEERIFFEQIKAKEIGEFAPSADLLIDEDDNEDNIFLVRYYFTEYKVGRAGVKLDWPVYHDNFREIIKEDLFPLLGRHISLLDWLREQRFACVRYDGNYALR